jgi:hypothetical protein
MEQAMGDVDDQMMVAIAALQRDEVRHDMQLPTEGGLHRLVVNGAEGPWVSGHAIARNGIYCATTPLFEEFFGASMPRLFFAIAIADHPQLRQPSRDASRSPGAMAVSNPDPGAEAGIETAPSEAPDPPPDPDGAVPRLLRDCPACSGTGRKPLIPKPPASFAFTGCGKCNGTGTIT